jgi:hypothetical protein
MSPDGNSVVTEGNENMVWQPNVGGIASFGDVETAAPPIIIPVSFTPPAPLFDAAPLAAEVSSIQIQAHEESHLPLREELGAEVSMATAPSSTTECTPASIPQDGNSGGLSGISIPSSSAGLLDRERDAAAIAERKAQLRADLGDDKNV